MADFKVFISYRRDDLVVAGAVGRFYDKLVAEYEEDNVFMDVDSIPPGVAWDDYLSESVHQAHVVLALIGPQWLGFIQEKQHAAVDYVRFEIQTALTRRIPVVPVLVRTPEMPTADELPESIARLARIQGFPVDTGRDFHAQMDRLIANVNRHHRDKGTVRVAIPPPVALPQAGEIRDFAGMKFAWCPPTGPQGFLMGSPPDEQGRQEHETQHPVVLTAGFWMGQFAVTQGEYERIAGNNPSHFKGSPRLPVECVSWDHAMAFVARLNSLHGSGLPAGYRFALPTEAQWEYACRAGTGTPFHFGAQLNGREANCNGNYPYGTSAQGPYLGKTVEVGSYSANPWNLFDMHGNVWEWCADWYEAYPNALVTDPVGAEVGSSRVIRGGGWSGGASICRSAYRLGLRPGDWYSFIGFRVAVSSTPASQ